MLIEQMARESPGWGISGPRTSCSASATGSARRRYVVLKRLRIPPAPQRGHTTWRQFLRTQASTMLACDFFHVDCAMTLHRLYAFLVLEAGTCHVHVWA